MGARRYAIAPGLTLEIAGARAARRHFAAEYQGAEAAADGTMPALRVAFTADAAGGFSGGHKTVGWQVALDDRLEDARVALRGRPRAFALSLVQGYVVEPLLSVAGARRDLVVLPSAAFVQDGGAVVLLGRSGAGKSTLMARALAAGRHVLADDQVVIDAAGGCFRLPRRTRVYTDFPVVAPHAYAALGARYKVALLARRGARTLSRGWVAPSLAVPPREIRDPGPGGPLPLRRLVVLERREEADDLEMRPLDAGTVLDEAAAVLSDQRARLAAAADPRIGAAVQAAAARERVVLGEALAGARLERLTVPAAWPAVRALSALEQALGTA